MQMNRKWFQLLTFWRAGYRIETYRHQRRAQRSNRRHTWVGCRNERTGVAYSRRHWFLFWMTVATPSMRKDCDHTAVSLSGYQASRASSPTAIPERSRLCLPQSETAIRHVQEGAANIGIPVIVHQYPAWTKVSHTTEELVELAKIPNVVAIKDGTRDIARYERNVRALRQSAPEVAILTCHDEYLLPTLVQGIDGALVGFAGFVPELICELVSAALNDHLTDARELTDKVYVLKQAVYRMGEPSADAHQRMKAAMFLRGLISSPIVRPPLSPLSPSVYAELEHELKRVGLFAPAEAVR